MPSSQLIRIYWSSPIPFLPTVSLGTVNAMENEPLVRNAPFLELCTSCKHDLYYYEQILLYCFSTDMIRPHASGQS